MKLLAGTLIRDYDTDEKEAAIIAAMAGGSFTNARALKNGNRLGIRDWVIEQMEALNSGSLSFVLALAEKLAKKKDRKWLNDALEMAKTWFRDLAVAKYAPFKIVNKDLEENIVRRCQRYDLDLLLERAAAVERAQREIESSANIRLVLENLFLTLSENNPDNSKKKYDEKSRNTI